MKKPAKKRSAKPRRATAKYTIRIASYTLESASLVFVARDPKGKVLFRHTVGMAEIEGL